MNCFARFAASALALSLVPAMLMGCGKKEASTGSDLDYIKQKGTLVVGITDFAPMDYQDADGSWIGFDADLAKAFAESLGVEVQFQTIEWDNKVMELDGKTIDVVWNGMTLTDEVTSSMACSNAYCNNAQVVILPADKAYRAIHQPQDAEELDGARRRLVFEEFFVFSAGLSLMRARRTVQQVGAYENLELEPFCAGLPFSLTGAQRRAMEEIAGDLRRGVPMNRLLQGDVGSGKTVVAAAAAYWAARNGVQTALMAPTEILAEQHYRTLGGLLEPLGVRCVLLTGSLTGGEKQRVRLALAGGQAELAIGTHALLSQTTEFARLGMVITDEQHRFGVAQRAALSEKGRGAHLLVMSATPIPRTLALILYGDLDVSILDELPPGRQRTDTFLVNETYRARLNGFLRKEVQAGHQCYVVCPSVEEGETESGKAAQVWAETLRQRVFPDLQVGLLHGRMKGPEKEAAMAEFARGKTQILVATTVIEVGVDVPNATVMVVEDADRFGLSQLHQLRGRVGRGPAKSYCILLSNNRNPDTQARLKALCKTGDGFRIAEEDLQLRGPGDFFGHRQHGLPTFRAANLSMDVSLLQQAQAAAALWIDRHGDADTPEAACLRARVESLFRDGSVAWN